MAEKKTLAANKNASQNPLLSSLRENDRKNLFQSNVTSYFHKTGFHLFDYYFGSVINVHDENGNIIEQKPRVGQASGTFNLFIGNSGTGKAEPVSTCIPTPRGPLPMGEIQPGVEVFDRYGEPTKVLKTFQFKDRHVYRVTFSDGRSTLCDIDHLWQVSYKSGLTEKTNVVSVQKLLDRGDYAKTNQKTGKTKYKYWIPKFISAVQYWKGKTILDPYIAGVLVALGPDKVKPDKKFSFSDKDIETDGNHGIIIAKNISDASKYNYRVEYMDNYDRQYIFYTDDNRRKNIEMVAPYDDDSNEYLISRNEYDKMFMENKGIPGYCIYNSPGVRKELLKGYCDMRARVIRVGNRYALAMTENNEVIRWEIKEISRSLGFDVPEKFSNKSENEIWIFGKCSALMSIVSNATTSFGYLRDGRIGDEMYDYYDQKLYITNIEFDHVEDTQCIYVENEEHLYLTKDYIITHNTTLAAQIAANIIRQYKYANVIHFDCENRFDASRCENITKLPSSFFDADIGERYMIRTGKVGLDVIQEMIVKTYVNKMRLKDQLYIDTGTTDEFGKPIKIFEPTVVIIDSITTVLNETFNPDSNKEASEAEKMRGNTEGARDAKSLKGFFKDVLPLCKEGNIIIFGINHINQNMSMNAFIPVAKQQNYLKQDEIIPGGKTMIYYPFNIVKLTAKPSDDFTEESDGFAGHIVMVEPIKSSSNQSGNNSKGISFELVFAHKYGFDSLRSIINYGRQYGLIEGNKTRMKFKDDPSFTFSLKNINKEKNEKPIWESVNKYIVPHLKEHLSFIEPEEIKFDSREFDY